MRAVGLPLLAPMSPQVAGRLSIQASAHCLERARGGEGILLGGVVGENAMMALGMGADDAVLDRTVDVLGRLARQFGPG